MVLLDNYTRKTSFMPHNLLLLPAPRQLNVLNDSLDLPDDRLIVLDAPNPQTLYFSAKRVQAALKLYAGVTWPIVAGTAVPTERVGLTLSVVSGGVAHPQGYQFSVTDSGIFIVAGTAAGAFYGSLTLSQILRQRGRSLPQLRINDWPDFPHRGVMLDISRDKVPTMKTLYNLVEKLAEWKINQLQLYTEHTFAYQNHPEVWAEASPLAGEEILALDAFCRERFIELVPNQNTFGHMRRWLTHERYRHLAECPDGCDTPWGYFDEPFTLNPEDPDSLNLVRGLLDELLPHFSSRQVNVGCDETVDLGQGRSAKAVAARGKGQVYLNYLLKLYRDIKARGRTMQFWGDIVMEHPELVPQLPRDAIALEWGYEAEHPFDENGARYAAAGIPFYVCPGTSSWNTIAGRAENALQNLRNAAQNGLKHGAVGYLITDWGDKGHWQPLPVSYLGFACGAALGWAYQANLEQDVAQLTGFYAFDDPTGKMGQLAYRLGNAYLRADWPAPNNSVLFSILQEEAEITAKRQGPTTEKLQETLDYLDSLSTEFADARANTPDADLIQREFIWGSDTLRHACRRGMWAMSGQDAAQKAALAADAERLIAEYRSLWLARNRQGGLKDSLALLEKMRQTYA